MTFGTATSDGICGVTSDLSTLKKDAWKTFSFFEVGFLVIYEG